MTVGSDQEDASARCTRSDVIPADSRTRDASNASVEADELQAGGRSSIATRATHAGSRTAEPATHPSASRSSSPSAKLSRTKSAIEAISNTVIEVQPLVANDVDRLVPTPVLSTGQEPMSSAGITASTPSLPNPAAALSLPHSGRRAGRPLPSPGYGAMDVGISGHPHSGGEASTASSRSHLPLQSKTSLYRQQASASSSISNERLSDAIGQTREGSGLSRAKSVSSVSSVNSTSSMEAVPFRAAPMGNVRVGFGGYARSRIAARRAEHRDAPSDDEDGSRLRSSGSEQQDESSGPVNRTDTTGQGRQKVLPKAPSDDWQYRNAPGLGVRAKSNSLVGANNFPPTFASSMGRAEGTESDGSSMHDVRPVKGSLRSKLAKRAGKLGLKPLTSVQASSSSSSPVQPNNILVRGEPLMDESARLISVPALPPSNRLTTTKMYLKDFSALGPGQDSDVPRAHSSVTNAPLVVPKNLPGPPGAGPPPSPGLVGTGTYANFPVQPTRLSPYELTGLRIDTDSLDPLEQAPEESGMHSQDSPQRVLLSQRQGSFSDSIGNVFNMVIGHNVIANRNSTNSMSTTSSSTSPGTPSPSLTPAQVIQMEARAGIATVPSEPSGAGPTPNDEMISERADADEGLVVRRPVSASISTQTTARPNVTLMQRWSNGAPPARQSPTSGSLRPSFLRALTSENFSKRASSRSSSRDETLSIEERSKRSNATPSSPMEKSASLSPASAHATSTKATGSPSMLRLELRDDEQDGGPTQSTKSTLSQKQNTETPPEQEPSIAGRRTDVIEDEPDESTGNLAAKTEHDTTVEKGERTVSVVNSSTTPSELPSIAVSSQSNSISSTSAVRDTDVPAPVATQPSLSTQPLDLQPLMDSSISRPVTPSVKDIDPASATNRSARTRDDFWFGEMIGEGSYSTVMQAWDILPLREKGQWNSRQAPSDASNALAAIAGKTGKASHRTKPELKGAKVYAIKILDKVHILKEKKQKYVNVEKQALSLLTRQPGIITLYWTFQDRDSLYFVLEMAPNGELLSLIKRLGSLSEECARFFSSQMLESLEAIHRAGILHRDVKPENILLASDMRIRIADFGSAKIVGPSRPSQATAETNGETKKSRPSSFVGTAEYVSPELLNDKHISQASDYWAFGCVLYQMLSGRPPFKGASEYQTFQKIMRRDLEFQEEFPQSAKDLIEKLLSLDPAQRPSYEDIKAHDFFRGLDWSEVWTCATPTMSAGMYKRPERNSLPPVASPMQGSSGVSDDGIRTDSEASRRTSEDTGAHSELQPDGENAATPPPPPSRGLHRRNTSGGDEADDDESSLSDSQYRPGRRRGMSTGASTTERVLARVGNSGRRGSNLLEKIAAGMSLIEKADSDGERNGAERQARPLPPAAEPAAMTANLTSWAALLLPHESLLYACPVLHRTGGNLLRSATKRRQLLLTDFPRLLCVKETNDELKVKSEVILGVPRSMRGQQSSGRFDVQADEYEWSDSALNGARSAFPMRRQSSAGPLFSSTAASSSASTGRSTNTGKDSPGLTAQRPFRRQSSTGFSLLQRSGSQATEIAVDGSSTNKLPSDPSQLHFANMPRLRGSFTAPTFVEAVQASPNVLTSVESKSQRTFIVHTPARSYQYEDPSGDASHWIKSITTAARRHGEAVGP